jgi:hypothetical protein
MLPQGSPAKIKLGSFTEIQHAHVCDTEHPTTRLGAGSSSVRRGKKYSNSRAEKLDNGNLFEAVLDNGLSLPQNDFHSEYQLTDSGAEGFEVAARLRAIPANGQIRQLFVNEDAE